ncbi:MAG: type IV pilin [Candidatus Thermoplasmatota archaeon]|nr:type IV pilin [Candidatus Thermoplasmatota archaeon]
MKINEKEAVSPVIGVILMVAITVVLAAIVYLWVVGFFGRVKTAPPMSATLSTYASGHQIEIKSVPVEGGGVSPAGIQYVLKDAAGKLLGNGTLAEIYSKYGASGVMFRDVSQDGLVSGGDVIWIKDNAHGGLATPGSTFQLVHTPSGQGWYLVNL